MNRLRVSIDEARELVLAAVERLPMVSASIDEARGCVLAEAVFAPENVPTFDNSAVDGYAVIARDVAGADDSPVELPVAGEIAAGAAGEQPLVSGSAIRIMTGAPVPPGADAVVMVENTERLDEGRRVRITTSVHPGQAIRGAGDDITAGTRV